MCRTQRWNPLTQTPTSRHVSILLRFGAGYWIEFQNESRRQRLVGLVGVFAAGHEFPTRCRSAIGFFLVKITGKDALDTVLG